MDNHFIKTKSDLIFFLKADALALKRKYRKPLFAFNLIWRCQIRLRKTEYLVNNSPNLLFGKIRAKIARLRLELFGTLLGYSISPNVFGPGLSIAHRGTIVVNGEAMVGANCRLHVCVNIGTSGGGNKAPKIGNNVYIAPGAKIFGDIKVADDIAIGANAVVNKSFLEPNITIGGIPAKKIADKGSDGIVIRAVEQVDN